MNLLFKSMISLQMAFGIRTIRMMLAVFPILMTAQLHTAAGQSPTAPAQAQAAAAQSPGKQVHGAMSLPAGHGTGISGKGISADFLHEQPAVLERHMRDLERLGVKWLRMDFSWSEMQPHGPEDQEFSKWVRIVQAARRHGIAILGLVTYCPPWANGKAPNQFYPPTDAQAFGRFAGLLARDFSPIGVHHWEIWNEPNLGGVFWMPTADPEGYTALLKAAYPAIKNADPSAVIITGGLSDAADEKATLTPMTFLNRIYQAGGKGYFDALGDHPYTYPALPDATDGSAHWWTLMFSGEQNLRSILAAHGDGEKQIWLTEYGAHTRGGKDFVNEKVQAEMVRAAYRLHAGYRWAGPLFWYTYQDSGTDETNEEDWYGLIRFDGTTKPAYGAYRAAERRAAAR